MKTIPLFLLISLSLSKLWASSDALILLDFVKEDHRVLLSAPVEAINKSEEEDSITEYQAAKIAENALEAWYAHLPVSIGEPTVRKEKYRYAHTHPVEQKELDVSFYWCSAMIGFGETPQAFYEIDFLILENGEVFQSIREYHPEFLYYNVSFKNGIPTESKEK